ncbi:AAEL010236-PA [Aedes aegypti]|uniref:AAEL010236-PA n=1 Tax=Aedes aegypti TaxID=7159 RepID=Q16TG9_AEDAE|nr:AAEL010236-PA [Aedes aegypti]
MLIELFDICANSWLKASLPKGTGKHGIRSDATTSTHPNGEMIQVMESKSCVLPGLLQTALCVATAC